MYKVVIFDFFGVFCAPIATNWFKKAVPDHEAQLAAFQALCTQGVWVFELLAKLRPVRSLSTKM